MNSPLQLLNAYLDGKTLTDEECACLSEWVVSDPANAQKVVEIGFLHEHLDDLLSIPRLLEELATSNSEANKKDLGELLDQVENLAPAARPGNFDPSPRTASRWLPLAVAASLLVLVGSGLGVGYWLNDVVHHAAKETPPADAEVAPPTAAPEHPAVVATLTHTVNSRWSLPSPAARGGHLWQGDKIELTEGLVAFTTSAGADVLIQAPSVAVVLGPNRLELLSGKVTVRAEDLPNGFIVDTPTAQVVDLGTEFGVQVDAKAATYVAVYEGEVSLQSVQQDSTGAASTKSITAGRVGHVSSEGQINWLVETLPHNREFVRFDEIAAIGRAQQGSSEAEQQVCYYELQRVPGLLGFHGFDVPSEGADFTVAFRHEPVRSRHTLSYERDIIDGRLYTSGSLSVAPDQSAYLALDTSADSPLARAGLLNEQGKVGRSATEMWLCWTTQAVAADSPGTHAGMSVMFGDERLVHEPVFVGVSEGEEGLALVTNVGSRVTRRLLDREPVTWTVDKLPVGDKPHLWLVRLSFGERADKVYVWCDVSPEQATTTPPHAAIDNANVMFDRLMLAVGDDAPSWRFDDFLIALNPEAISSGLRTIHGHEPVVQQQ